MSCIFLVSLSSPYVHDARSQKPKIIKDVHQCIRTAQNVWKIEESKFKTSEFAF